MGGIREENRPVSSLENDQCPSQPWASCCRCCEDATSASQWDSERVLLLRLGACVCIYIYIHVCVCVCVCVVCAGFFVHVCAGGWACVKFLQRAHSAHRLAVYMSCRRICDWAPVSNVARVLADRALGQDRIAAAVTLVAAVSRATSRVAEGRASPHCIFPLVPRACANTRYHLDL